MNKPNFILHKFNFDYLILALIGFGEISYSVKLMYLAEQNYLVFYLHVLFFFSHGCVLFGIPFYIKKSKSVIKLIRNILLLLLPLFILALV